MARSGSIKQTDRRGSSADGWFLTVVELAHTFGPDRLPLTFRVALKRTGDDGMVDVEPEDDGDPPDTEFARAVKAWISVPLSLASSSLTTMIALFAFCRLASLRECDDDACLSLPLCCRSFSQFV